MLAATLPPPIIARGADMKKVLIIEDEPDILDVVRLALVPDGYQILAATTGEKALEMAVTDPPDLILLDIMLPGRSGLDVCQQLKNDPHTQEIPIIILTARALDSDIQAGYQAGCDEYIVKPFDVLSLAERVREFLED
jgi:DNA-binding response OmpR family regulator